MLAFGRGLVILEGLLGKQLVDLVVPESVEVVAALGPSLLLLLLDHLLIDHHRQVVARQRLEG